MKAGIDEMSWLERPVADHRIRDLHFLIRMPLIWQAPVETANTKQAADENDREPLKRHRKAPRRDASGAHLESADTQADLRRPVPMKPATLVRIFNGGNVAGDVPEKKAACPAPRRSPNSRARRV